MKIIKKAYRVWVYSHIGEYPVFKIDDIEPVYAKNPSEAKRQCDLYDATNKDGDAAIWTDIKCIRAKDYDKVEYEGIITNRGNAEYSKKEKERIQKRKKDLDKLPDNEMFYVQDARTYVGNSVLWWGLESRGYVTDISKAQKYTKQEIVERFVSNRDTDIIWNASHVESNIKQHVDVQGLKKEYSY